MSAFTEYLASIRKELDCGVATEHTYRPALKALLEAIGKGIVATNEPKHILCGAPDFRVTLKNVLLGHIEAKDIDTNLDEMERGKGQHGEQFIRFRDGLPNWLLTDYLEFRWFVNGIKRLTARFAEIDAKGKIAPTKNGEQKLSQLFQSFLCEPALTVATAKDLATSMAHMTRIVRTQIVESFKKETEETELHHDGPWLHNWLIAFRETLIPGLDEKLFADMFAQTLAYGLFAARIHTPPNNTFTREMAAYNLPKTNPFLRKLFAEIAGIDMPDSLAWAVDDIVELLKHADMFEILKDFGKGKGKEDPVVHFYETFLNAYDPKVRELRGVYFTPESVVSYIVRSIDYLLKTRFKRPKGLADENTLILDPATGTATFIYVAIDLIHQKFNKQAGIWNAYVANHLLNRIFGFELLMAPYAVAHLKLGMQLQDSGYKFESDQRLGIYLTNTLEEAAKKSDIIFATWVADEANAAAKIKRDDPILVVLGNPPYSGHSANRSRNEDGNLTFIGGLIEDYKSGCPELHKPAQAKWLQDDYVKFIRFGQWRIDRTGEGIFGFITNHGYLDNPTFRGMRRSLMHSFNEIYVYDLHGNSKKKEKAPGGREDKNVFDIQQGVAILLCTKEKGNKDIAKVHHADLWGPREIKYDTLRNTSVSETAWNNLSPSAPSFFFFPQNKILIDEYESGWNVATIFNQNGDPAPGIVTTHDQFAIAFSQHELQNNIQVFLETSTEDEARNMFRLCRQSQWNYARAKAELSQNVWHKDVLQISYRPFDYRWTIYNPHVAVHRRERVMKHMLFDENVGMVMPRRLESSEQWCNIMVTNRIVDHVAVSLKSVDYLFPLFIYFRSKDGPTLSDEHHANLNPDFLKELAKRLNLPRAGKYGLPRGLQPRDIFNYLYAILFSPTYRKRYSEFLKIDFPRLPLTSNLALFRALASRGAELVALHLLESPKVHKFITAFPEKGSMVVEKVRYTDEDKRVWFNETQYVSGVPKAIWEFYIGGYQVCEKWLKDRKGRKLSYDDIQQYQKIIVALNETIHLMSEIDSIIPSWPITQEKGNRSTK